MLCRALLCVQDSSWGPREGLTGSQTLLRPRSIPACVHWCACTGKIKMGGTRGLLTRSNDPSGVSPISTGRTLSILARRESPPSSLCPAVARGPGARFGCVQRRRWAGLISCCCCCRLPEREERPGCELAESCVCRAGSNVCRGPRSALAARLQAAALQGPGSGSSPACVAGAHAGASAAAAPACSGGDAPSSGLESC